MKKKYLQNTGGLSLSLPSGLSKNALAPLTQQFRTYSDFIADAAPAHYWKLSETAGTVAADTKGASGNGTIKGTVTYNRTSPVTTDGNKAILFDGSSGYVEIPAGVDVTAYTKLSVEFWMNIPSLAAINHDARVFANSHTDADNNGIQIHIAGGGNGGAFALGNGSGNSTVYIGGVNFSEGVNYHIVCTWNGSLMQWYINGAKNSSGNFTGPISASGFPINIGRNPAYTGDYFPGIISNVSLYTVVLTQEQVLDHLHAGTMYLKYMALPQDMMNWSNQYKFGNTATFNNELETYLRKNVSIVNNTLQLEGQNTGGGDPSVAGGKYTSGMVASYNAVSFLYGHIEASIKFPTGFGVWPAFWMLYNYLIQSNELDIAEIFETSTTLNEGVHWPVNQSAGGPYTVSDMGAAFYTYGLTWTPTALQFYWDGTPKLLYTTAANIPSDYMYILLNVALSGVAVNNDIPADNQFPIDMYIQWVKIWQDTQSYNKMIFS